MISTSNNFVGQNAENLNLIFFIIYMKTVDGKQSEN